jgi:hypothetical protein
MTVIDFDNDAEQWDGAVGSSQKMVKWHRTNKILVCIVILVDHLAALPSKTGGPAARVIELVCRAWNAVRSGNVQPSLRAKRHTYRTDQ